MRLSIIPRRVVQQCDPCPCLPSNRKNERLHIVHCESFTMRSLAIDRPILLDQSQGAPDEAARDEASPKKKSPRDLSGAFV